MEQVREQVLKGYLEYICGKENVDENVMLSTKTTFRIGGPARFFVTVQTKEQLMRLVSTLKYIEQRWFIIGAGANVLASDNGYDGVVIKLGFTEIVDNGCFVYADAGASLKKLCNFAREHTLAGLEFASGIPGTVGGAVYMNAGAHGAQTSDVVAMVDVLIDGEVRALDINTLNFKYRHSVFHNKPDWIILGAYFFLRKCSTPAEISAKQQKFLALRSQSQPNQPSAGSVFKRPSDDFAVGKAIDELGLKGTQIGGACISEKHAGFIVNTGGATCDDVLKLIKLVRRKIKQAHGLYLQTEIQMLE
jgi:UDP-N-acetylmuramate dehydrogenase